VTWTYNAAATTQTLPRSPSRPQNPNLTLSRTPSIFLIANPRLEFPASTTKQTTSHFLIANRLHFFNSALVNPAVSSPISPKRMLLSASPSLRATSLLAKAHSASDRFPLTNHKSPVARLFRED